MFDLIAICLNVFKKFSIIIYKKFQFNYITEYKNKYLGEKMKNTKESNETTQRAELHRKIWAIADNERG
ncbi:hypothetical protein, partial [uncultured Leptotrichia sp.]|uniref:hypothetical protein n=1 Tax=uncultured Leptotrichia sp. TaxID=159271 RepID=UPI0026340090